ncbi:MULTISPECIES: sugar ABC transporter substrate-binding protein [Brevibacillus]|uniref:Putative ribose ABC transporter substrate binding protein n=1 Tax=Brevibacillus brevis (strain 47 / JCM 6285 / NBRC 100599) TaxID=358681 RepID=C0Z5I4_BREBN|nr:MULTISPECIES: sugar ABC transporter substrate-binding protein [Bacillales]TQR32010.1 sugar ABC transporter substrate-binding protein [Lysinibacillus sp. SDF0063]UIO41888.1 sugar ABC transporter substrate-binding protein [Brevibacillus brevis]WGV59415.1 sugar ABC transporter substrate-binding protein [Brevibacillus brevis]BAH46090.1 putative ribose ABC transporter substrate binding protein precursor [Brevibacillus brevis NBRC 100599]
MKKKLGLITSLVLAASVLVTACGSGATTGTGSTNGGASGEKAKRIALIMRQNVGTFSAQYINGVKKEVEKNGGELTVFNADTDLAKMASNLDAAVNQRFDGILIDHGTAEALQQGTQKAVDKKIPVVLFDTDINIPGVPVVAQDDNKLAELSLEKLAADTNGKGNIVKVWVAGFAPMEKRQVTYEAFQKKYPDLKEIAAFGSATNNTALDTQTQMEAILKKYPNKGDITAVWAAWDEFAKGATRAIQQAGRTEIKVYSIDLSDEDLQMIQAENSPWAATAAVDPSNIGRIHAQTVFQKIKGEQVPDNVKLNPVLVKQEDLPKDKKVTMGDLSQYVQEWGK